MIGLWKNARLAKSPVRLQRAAAETEPVGAQVYEYHKAIPRDRRKGAADRMLDVGAATPVDVNSLEGRNKTSG